MKILHTSDWHLGQSFFTKSRKNEHQAFINWLLELVAAEQIDAVIIAGDIFDTSTPPSYAREMYNQFVVDLQKQGCLLVVLGGNHDSVAMLNESRQLLACLDTHVVASTGMALEQQLIDIPDKQGSLGAILCAVPYIRPRDVLQSSAGESGEDKRQALGEAIKLHYASLFKLAEAKKQASGLDIPIIASGHLSAIGVSQSDSVRDIYIGTLEGFAADGFPPADYIALGHIHRPQIVAKSEHIRYSGSPIPLSFDELNSQKQVVIVEFDKACRRAVRPVDVPVFQPMQVIKGDLKALESQLQQFASNSTEKSTWLCLEVKTQDHLSDLQQRVQALTDDLNVDILQLRRCRHLHNQTLAQQHKETLSELNPQQVFAKRLELERFDSAEEQARQLRIRQRFNQVLVEVQQGEQGEAE